MSYSPSRPTGHVFIATSLDGFIARPDGDIEWLVSFPGTLGEDHGYDTFNAGIDGLIMGRGTYEKMLPVEPWFYSRPVVVLSSRLAGMEPPEHLRGKVVFRDETPEVAMAHVAAEGWRRVYVDGGQVVQAFLRVGLIADMVITQVPILLGAGLPLFGPTERDIRLARQETRTFASGLVQSRFTVAG